MNRLAVLLLSWLVALSALAQEAAADQTPASAEQATRPAPAQAEPQPKQGLSIEEAYQKEFAFLEAQRQDLLRRIEETRERHAGAESELRAEVQALQQRVVRQDSEADRVEERVLQSEEQVQVNADNREVLSATFRQAGATLEQYGIEVLETEDFRALADDERVRVLFDEARELVGELSRIRRTQGAFYTPEGKEVTGEILRVGNIAAYGRSAEAAGVLAPAGGDRLKIWPEDVAGEARAVMEGKAGAVIPVFLFESLAREIEAKKDKGPVQVINDGGTIGWIIVVLGLVATVMIVLRALFLKSAGTSTEKLSRRVAGFVGQGQFEEAREYCNRLRNAPGRVVAAAVRNLDRDRDHIEDIVSEAILHENNHLNRFGTAILVIAAVSPLLGLLGTVTGMIATFDVITEFGTGDPKLLSGGIAIALVTTELGLIVAIPALLLGNLLSGWAERIKDDMEKAALHVINASQERRLKLKSAA